MAVQALRERRVDTLAGLLDAHGRELQAVAYLILRDRALAEDITIETLLTAFEHGSEIRDESSLRAWLLRVATNKALSARRSGSRLIHVASVPDVAAGRDLADDASDRIAVLQAVDRLPIQMRAAVVLRYYADLPVDGVAAALGKSPNTVKSQLQTALDRLRDALAEPALPAGETTHG